MNHDRDKATLLLVSVLALAIATGLGARLGWEVAAGSAPAQHAVQLTAVHAGP